MPPIRTTMNNYPKRIYVLPARPVPRGSSMTPSPVKALKRNFLDEEVAELLGDDLGPTAPRKRERLNHLTQEEKMDRRKFKNRVAAQNARDKKKERSGKVEEVVRELLAENKRLQRENEALRRQNEELIMNTATNNYATPEYSPKYSSSQQESQNENDSIIYSNVAYEEEVVEDIRENSMDEIEEEDQCAFESAEFINAPLPWDKADRSANNVSSNISLNVNNNSPSKATKMNVASYLHLAMFLSNMNAKPIKTTSTSTESSTILRAHPEMSMNSLPTSLKKESSTPIRRLLPQDPSTVSPKRRVKHFHRRVP